MCLLFFPTFCNGLVPLFSDFEKIMVYLDCLAGSFAGRIAVAAHMYDSRRSGVFEETAGIPPQIIIQLLPLNMEVVPMYRSVSLNNIPRTN